MEIAQSYKTPNQPDKKATHCGGEENMIFRDIALLIKLSKFQQKNHNIDLSKTGEQPSKWKR